MAEIKNTERLLEKFARGLDKTALPTGAAVRGISGGSELGLLAGAAVSKTGDIVRKISGLTEKEPIQKVEKYTEETKDELKLIKQSDEEYYPEITGTLDRISKDLSIITGSKEKEKALDFGEDLFKSDDAEEIVDEIVLLRKQNEKNELDQLEKSRESGRDDDDEDKSILEKFVNQFKKFGSNLFGKEGSITLLMGSVVSLLVNIAGGAMAIIAGPVTMFKAFIAEIKLTFEYLKKQFKAVKKLNIVKSFTDFAKTLRSFLGLQVQALFEVIKNTKIFKYIDNFFDYFRKLGAGLNKKVNTAKKYLDLVSNFFKNIYTTVKNSKIFKMISSAFGGISNTFSKIGTYIKANSKVFKIMTRVFSGIGKLAGPLGLIFVALDGVFGFIRGFKEGGIIGGIKEGLIGMLDGLADIFIRFPTWILTKVLSLLGFEETASTISESINAIIEIVYDSIRAAIDFIVKPIKLLWDLVTSPFDILYGIVEMLWDPKKGFGRILDTITGVLGSLKDFILSPFILIYDLLSSTLSNLGIDLENFEFIKKIKETVQSIKDYFADLIDKYNPVKAVGGFIRRIGSSVGIMDSAEEVQRKKDEQYEKEQEERDAPRKKIEEKWWKEEQSNMRAREQRMTVKGFDELGSLSKHFEAGTRGSSAIGFDRTGGTSYGKYQIATRTGTMDSFMKYLSDTNPEAYKRLKKAGPADAGIHGDFAKEWKKLAREGVLGNSEHEFIKKTHYDVGMKGVKDENLQKMLGESKALQQVMWSTSVQHGGGGASNIFNKVYKEGMSEQDLIKEIYAERNTKFGSSTPETQKSVEKRFIQEQRMALAMSDPNYNLANATTLEPSSKDYAQKVESGTESVKVAQAQATGNTYNTVNNTSSGGGLQNQTGDTMAQGPSGTESIGMGILSILTG